MTEDGPPVLIYLTISDPEMARKMKNWEEAQLSKDEVVIAVKVFDCYMVDEIALKKNDLLREMIGKAKAPGFYTFHKGKRLFKADGMPKSSAIFTCLKKTVSKVYKAKLDTLVGKVGKMELEVQKNDDRVTLLKQKMTRMKEKDKGRKKILAEIDSILARNKVLKDEVNDLLDLEKAKREAAKKTAKR